MSPGRLTARLWADASYVVGRVAVGLWSYLLLVAGLAVAPAAALAAGLGLVFGLPLVAALWVGVVLGSWVLPAVRSWRAEHPLHRQVAQVLGLVGRAAGRALAWWLLSIRAVARKDRDRAAAHGGREIPIAYRPLRAGTAALKVLLVDPATRRDVLYLVLAPVWAAAVLLSVGVAVAGGVEAVSSAIGNVGAGSGATALSTEEAWVRAISGLGLLLAAPFLMHLGVRGGVALGMALLSTGESARMHAELEEQMLRRQLAVDAAERERRRIERDLHDGAQQRLVALGISLGMAREALPEDPATGAQLVEEAHAEAKLALAELRDLARGIHPAILGDRGLDAALSDLVRRTVTPVSIFVVTPRRPPAVVESAAYFVVAEALTNVSRHAQASRATVRVGQDEGWVRVEISDDGVGGADPTGGTGLKGLADRVGALGGRLRVDSPAGGPTTITADIPCAS